MTSCWFTTNAAALQAEAFLPPLWHSIELLQTNFIIRIALIHPAFNTASQRLPPDFPTPWGKEVPQRTNQFFGVKGIY